MIVYTHNGHDYRFEILPQATCLGLPLTAYTVDGLTLTVENGVGDWTRCRAEFHEDGFVFLDITGHVLAEYVEIVPDEMELTEDNPVRVRDWFRRQWSDESGS